MEFTRAGRRPDELRLERRPRLRLPAAYGAMLANALRVGRTTATVNLKYSFMRATPTSASSRTSRCDGRREGPHPPKYGPLVRHGLQPRQRHAAHRGHAVRRCGWTRRSPSTGTSTRASPSTTSRSSSAPSDGATNPGIMQGDQRDSRRPANAEARSSSSTTTTRPRSATGRARARQYGDIRYNILRWVSDQDMQDGSPA